MRNKMRLGDIATLITKGTTPTSVGYTFTDTGVNFVKIESIREDGTFIPDKFAHISDECNTKLKRSQLQENDILFSIAGAIGRTAIVTKDCLPANTNQALAIIRIPQGVIDYRFLLYALQSDAIIEQAEKQKQGVAQLNLSLQNINDFEIPFFTEEEQLTVVEVLSSVDSLLSTRIAQLEQLDELVKSRFIELFGDSTHSTNKVLLEDISAFVTVGIANSATHAYVDNGIVMLRNQNIKENHLDENDLIYITPDFAKKYGSKQLAENDILVIRTGYPGMACLVPKKYEGCQTFTTLIVRLKDSTSAHANYVCHYINSSFGKDYVEQSKVGVAQQNFGAKALAKMPIVVPPMELQEEFAAFVEQTDKSKLAVQQSIILARNSHTLSK